jgi:hypothetical protein
MGKTMSFAFSGGHPVKNYLENSPEPYLNAIIANLLRAKGYKNFPANFLNVYEQKIQRS